MTKKPLLISIGEILWDLLPGSKQLGGTAANVSFHAHALGAEALLVSGVGNDEDGREMLASLRTLGMATYGITTDREAPTGTVRVGIDADGKPTFEIRERVAWDYIEPDQRVLEEAGRADVICFGSTGQRGQQSRRTLGASGLKSLNEG